MTKYIKTVTAMLLCFSAILCTFTCTYADNEMRGMWISTVYNLDYPSTPTTDSTKLKSEADEILDSCKAMGINNVFLQVRPNSDALYKSSIYPWSAYLTGQQGLAPDDDFDPLKYWIEGAHSRGMKLHAWINPYRATKVNSSNENALTGIASNNPLALHPEYAIKYVDGNYYYNPALPEVRQMVINGILEIVNNYDVDGIHMDDYFYPGADFQDDASFQQLSGGFTDKGDWRRNNVNLLVLGIKKSIDATGKNVEFGISPAGIWANKSNNPLGSDTAGNEAYYAHYADTRKWALEGTVDYIAPQIYWEIGHPKADYKVLVNWWADTLKNAPAKLYIGIADYKAYNITNTQSVWYGSGEVIRQMTFNKNTPKVGGEIHFRYKMIKNIPTMADKIAEFYKGSVTQPTTAASEKPIETTTQATTKPQTTQPQTLDKNEIRVIVNGKQVAFDQKPVIENGRTLVPMRAIFEALNADVQWDNDTRSVLAEAANGTKITLMIDSKNMLINGKDMIVLDVPAKIMGSRTMVPLRAVSEAFNCKVDWDGGNRLVTIEE